MKRVLSVLSAICLLITFLPTAVTAQTYEDLTYSVSNGQVTITDCAESATGELVIPAAIAGYPVTTIASSAFADCANLTAITIGNSVTSIGNLAFSGCTGLTAITVADGNPVYHSAGNCLVETSSKILVAGCKNSVIPADGSVTSIGSFAFHKCAGLTTLTLPDSILSIGNAAFEGCAQLAAFSFGSNVTSIGNNAFQDCVALVDIIIPDSVTAMGVYAFYGCTALNTVTIGDQLSVISNSAFALCTALTDVAIGSGVVTIDVFAFNGCGKLTDIVLPNGVETIGKFAFYNCEALTDVEIPKSVSTIGNNAFAGCANLTLSINEENTYAISYAQNKGIPHTVIGIGSLAVKTVTLRPGVAGVYFNSNLDWAENDARILSYGIAVSTENPLPVADDSDASSLYTHSTKSALISDILEPENGKEVNAANAKIKIYARAYVKLANGEYAYSDAVNVNLYQVVIAAQNRWDTLTTTQQDALEQMYNTYSEVMSSWDVPNLK